MSSSSASSQEPVSLFYSFHSVPKPTKTNHKITQVEVGGRDPCVQQLTHSLEMEQDDPLGDTQLRLNLGDRQTRGSVSRRLGQMEEDQSKNKLDFQSTKHIWNLAVLPRYPRKLENDLACLGF